jgi:hypothetical protein
MMAKPRNKRQRRKCRLSTDQAKNPNIPSVTKKERPANHLERTQTTRKTNKKKPTKRT